LADGFVELSAVMAHKRFTGVTFEQIQDVVKTCPKQRYTLIAQTTSNTSNNMEDMKANDILLELEKAQETVTNQGDTLETIGAQTPVTNGTGDESKRSRYANTKRSLVFLL
jgi:hypothetical protein